MNVFRAENTTTSNPSLGVCRRPRRAAITNHHSLGGLNKRSLFSHSSWRYRIPKQPSPGLVSPEAALLGWHMAPFSLCLNVAFSLCGQMSPSYKDTRQAYPEGLTLRYCLFKDPEPRCGDIPSIGD